MRPRHSTLLRLFDYFGALLYGVVASTLAGFFVSSTLPVLAKMFFGMAIGMASGFPVLILLTILCGGFEIVMISMLVCMVAGMGAGMAVDKPIIWFICYGAIVGIGIQALLHIHDAKLHGPVAMGEATDDEQ